MTPPDAPAFDRLSGLLEHFRVRAALHHTGALCGLTHFDAGEGHAYLHVLRRGVLDVRHNVGATTVGAISLQADTGDIELSAKTAELPDTDPRVQAEPALDKAERDYLREKLRSGKFIINAIEQRQRTIERITREIVEGRSARVVSRLPGPIVA